MPPTLWANLFFVLNAFDHLSTLVTDAKRPGSIHTPTLNKLNVRENARLRYRAQPFDKRQPMQDRSFSYLASDAISSHKPTHQLFEGRRMRADLAKSDASEVNFLTNLDAMASIGYGHWTASMERDAKLFSDVLEQTRRQNRRCDGEHIEDYSLYEFVKRLRFYNERRKGSSWARMQAVLARTKEAIGMEPIDVEAEIEEEIQSNHEWITYYENEIQTLSETEHMPLEEFCRPLVVPLAVELDIDFDDSASDLTVVSNVTDYVENRYAKGILKKSDMPEDFDCPICYLTHKAAEGVITNSCKHIFCREALQIWVDTTAQGNHNACPKCRGKLFSESRHPANRMASAQRGLEEAKRDLETLRDVLESLEWLDKEIELHELFVRETSSPEDDSEDSLDGASEYDPSESDISEHWSDGYCEACRNASQGESSSEESDDSDSASDGFSETVRHWETMSGSESSSSDE
jgi:hypothetical protein